MLIGHVVWKHVGQLMFTQFFLEIILSHGVPNAEYCALANAAFEVVWVTQFLLEHICSAS